ncbi:MAG: glycosyltransferase family 2 protein [Flavisolibacter sp.]
MRKGLSVVIPNYNGIELFPQTLPTVFDALKQIHIPFEVIVSDDCSSDDSLNYLKKNFPSVHIIQNETNSGFSVTANRGIWEANHDLVFLLNSDVKLEPEYFLNQFRYFDRPDTFGVMGRIIGWEDEQIQDGAKYPSFHSAKIKTSRNYLLCDEKAMNDGIYTTYLSGANALMDRKKLLEMGGFNEIFSPFYVEDYELSLRAWRLGWKCYYEHAAVCRHRTSTSIKSKSRKWFIKMISNRNKMYLHAIHLTPSWRLLWWIQILPEVLVQSIFLKTYYLKAFFLFLSNYSSVRASRRELLILAGDRELLSVKQVAHFIQSSVKDLKLKFF